MCVIAPCDPALYQMQYIRNLGRHVNFASLFSHNFRFFFLLPPPLNVLCSFVKWFGLLLCSFLFVSLLISHSTTSPFPLSLSGFPHHLAAPLIWAPLDEINMRWRKRDKYLWLLRLYNSACQCVLALCVCVHTYIHGRVCFICLETHGYCWCQGLSWDK